MTPERLQEQEREHAPSAAPERDGARDGWLSGQVRLGEDGRARLQVKLGDMHCSFCVSTIEKALTRREGVERVSVSLAHEEGLVEYQPERIGPQEIVDTLRAVGYSVRDPRKLRSFEEDEAALAAERNRFLVGLGFTLLALVLMVFKWTGNQSLLTV